MKAPFGHWGTQTFIAALRHDGLTAPWVIDRPMSREIFETYVETQLAPTLQRGDMVRIANASARRLNDSRLRSCFMNAHGGLKNNFASICNDL